MYERAKPNFRGLFEGKECKYYRLSSSFHTIDFGKPSIVYIRFKIDAKFLLPDAEDN